MVKTLKCECLLFCFGAKFIYYVWMLSWARTVFMVFDKTVVTHWETSRRFPKVVLVKNFFLLIYNPLVHRKKSPNICISHEEESFFSHVELQHKLSKSSREKNSRRSSSSRARPLKKSRAAPTITITARFKFLLMIGTVIKTLSSCLHKGIKCVVMQI